MFRSKAMFVLVLAAAAALGLISQAVSQEADQGGGRGGRGNRDPEQMRQQMEQFRQREATRMKEELAVTDEEWKVLQPRIEKVQTLSRQARGGMGFRMMGRRGGRPGGEQPAEGAARPQSDVEKKLSDLQKVLQNKEAKPEEIKPALTAYREARAKVNEEYQQAQKELKEVLTMRQEAQLVTVGLLE